MVKCLIGLTVAVVGCLLFACFPVEAQPPRAEDKWDYGIWIFSPLNTTYTQNTLLLNVTAKRYISPTYYVAKLKYCINGGEITSIFTGASFVKNPPLGIFGDIASYSLFSGTAILPELPQGNYNLTVYGDYTRKEGVDPKWPNMHDVQTIDFTINNGIPPAITLLPFEKVITEKGNLTLNFVVDKPVSWIGYSFDREDNATVCGNFTISELTYGSHNVTVYAKDLLGNIGASETTIFTITKPGQAQIDPWFVGIIATIIAIACIGVAILFLRKKIALKRKE